MVVGRELFAQLGVCYRCGCLHIHARIRCLQLEINAASPVLNANGMSFQVFF